MDVDFSEFPFYVINLSGDYSVDELKKFAEILEDEIEAIGEVSKVDIQGINSKEIQINVDIHKLESFELGFTDLENAVNYENMSISGGEVKLGDTRRSVRVIGEFETVDEIKNIIVKNEKGNIVYLRDVAEVKEDYEEVSSYARLDDQPVVSLQVIKKGGENILDATKKVEDVLAIAKAKHILPENVEVSITNDQSDSVKKQLSNLENSMIMSIIFVVTVLFFFLGTRNALFVGIAIPLSMFLSFLVLQSLDYRVNMIVLFALILALGMLVDNAIVVVENIYRFINLGYSRFEAAKQAVGEIAIPIIASTATTLAAFIPLLFWDSMMGEFMKYLPITLIIVLTSSLFVALVIIPVFSSSFSKKGAQNEPPNKRKALKIAAVLAVLSTVAFLFSNLLIGNLLGIAATVTILNLYVFNDIGKWFQNLFLVKLENIYSRILNRSLRGRTPMILFIGTFILLFATIGLMYVRSPKVVFFPDGDPNLINIMAELPIGTDIEASDEFIIGMETYIAEILNPYDAIIKSRLTNVGEGAKGENDLGKAPPNKGLVTIFFEDYKERGDISTSDIMKQLSDSLVGKYPGVQITIEKEKNGPPTGKPINIEVIGADFDKLLTLSDSVKFIIENEKIEGIEGLKFDLDIGKPEMIVKIDREKARRYGLSTGQIGSTIRTSLFGKEISDFKVGEEEYPIQLRLKEEQRNSIPTLMNQKITFRNNMGKLMQIPISAVASFEFSTTYGAVKRKDLDRVVTIYSNVIEGYNANEINAELKALLADFEMPEGYQYKFTGEQQDQEEAMGFLIAAFAVAFALILLILVTQFNSVVKPLIILGSIVFSTIGVFGGIATFGMEVVIIMTGIGIVSLAGIVVNNAIVLIDYIDLLKRDKRIELGLEEGAFLPVEHATACIIQGGRTRLRPVLLTAITTILGLIPMAIGLNIDFQSMLTTFDPQISFGGDMTKMWAPLSWTVIFGLTFSTFLTLIIVPVMYRIANKGQYRILKTLKKI